jgi:hypothetical protein
MQRPPYAFPIAPCLHGEFPILRSQLLPTLKYLFHSSGNHPWLFAVADHSESLPAARLAVGEDANLKQNEAEGLA